MAQMSDLERHFILAIKGDYPTWGYKKMKEVFPVYFESHNITLKKVKGLLATLKAKGPEKAETRQRGPSRPLVVNSPMRTRN